MVAGDSGNLIQLLYLEVVGVRAGVHKDPLQLLYLKVVGVRRDPLEFGSVHLTEVVSVFDQGPLLAIQGLEKIGNYTDSFLLICI